MPEASLRSQQSVIINAPLEVVWEYNADLARIAEFHPRVDKVELIDGQSRRAAGVGYKCHLRGGRHTCIERDIEVVPMERIVTTLSEDSFGVARLLPDYRVETTLERVGAGRTRVEFRHYYSIRGWKAWLFHWIAGRRIARESQATLNAMKQAIETRASELLAQEERFGRTRRCSRRRGHVALLDFVAHSAPAAAERCRSASKTLATSLCMETRDEALAAPSGEGWPPWSCSPPASVNRDSL